MDPPAVGEDINDITKHSGEATKLTDKVLWSEDSN